MLRVLVYAVPLVLAIYAIVDCLQTPEGQLRGIPRIGWLLLIVFFPLVGAIAWLFAGRARGGSQRAGRSWPPGAPSGPPRRVLAPDDDPEFLRQLGRDAHRQTSSEQQAQLDQWEQDLRRRESDLRDGPGTDDGPPDDDGAGAPRS